MATSNPPVALFHDGHGGAAERRIWEHACAQLSDRVTVYPNVSLARPRGPRSVDGAPAESEHDLVIVDPDRGITLVEVKSGTIIHRADDRTWRRQEDRHVFRPSPPEQLTRQRHELRRALAAHDPSLESVPIRVALAVPDCDFSTPSETMIPAVSVWDRGAALGEHGLTAAYHRLWDAQPVVDHPDATELPMNRWRLNKVHAVLAGRSVHGVTHLGDRFAANDSRLGREVPAALLRNAVRVASARNVLVTGAAGTGKTTLALELAAAAAIRDERVLLTCYRRTLGAWHRRQLSRILFADGHLQAAIRVRADATGSIAVNEINELSRAKPADGEDRGQFYVHLAPEFVTEERLGGRFDCIIVDEWQALPDTYHDALRRLLRPDGRFLAFGDADQALFGMELARDGFDHVVELETNRRTTRQIAEVAALVSGSDDPPIGVDGLPVETVASRADALGDDAQVAREQLLEAGVHDGDLAILWLGRAPKRVERGDLVDRYVAGHGVETTVAAFAGLERDAVILVLDVDTLVNRVSREELRRLVHVGVTRARSKLVLVGDPTRLRLSGFGALADLVSGGGPTPAA